MVLKNKKPKLFIRRRHKTLHINNCSLIRLLKEKKEGKSEEKR